MINDEKMKTALGDDADTVDKTTQEGLSWLEEAEDSYNCEEYISCIYIYSNFNEEKEKDYKKMFDLIGKSNKEKKDYNPQNRPKRQKLPSHLPRNEITLNPDSTCPECGGVEFSKIGEDVKEELEDIPASYIVKKYVRPRCICKCW